MSRVFIIQGIYFPGYFLLYTYCSVYFSALVSTLCVFSRLVHCYVLHHGPGETLICSNVYMLRILKNGNKITLDLTWHLDLQL